jgi:hypothetical protein
VPISTWLAAQVLRPHHADDAEHTDRGVAPTRDDSGSDA